MPKRLNPFGDSSPLQFKTHIGPKELATGSRQEELMKDVFDKTRDKLFTGAQRSIDLNDNHMQSMVPPRQSALDASTRFEPMQMLLDGTGYLVSPLPMPSSSTTKHCTEFNGSVDCGNSATSLRSQTPVTSAPAPAPGQLRLDSNGHLTAPLHGDAMDCDSDIQVTNGGAVPGAGHSSSACGGASGGLHRFGFKSTKQASQKSGGNRALCETCRQIPGGRRCQFCERAVCQGCVRQCDSCSDYFCQLCSTLNYDAAMERAFCLSCAG